MRVFVDALTSKTERNPWMVKAACRGADPDLFYSTLHSQQQEAIRYCRICPVRDECLQYAFDHGEHRGIWGGQTEGARRKLVKAARREQAVGDSGGDLTQ